jgi:hypothetical protein
MTIPFTCPHCGTQTDVFEEYAGQTGPCAICGKMITVPYPPTASGRAESTSDTGSTPGPSTGPSRSTAWTVLLIVIAGLAAAGTLVGLLLLVAFPAVNAARQASNKSQSRANLQLIATAMLNYEADHGCLPPAYLADKDGQPMHSWRVLLLPYLGYDHIYEQYDLGQRWDCPQNMLLLASMPAEYACPADADAGPAGETSYMVITGPNTPFPGADSVRRAEVLDGMENTILLAQTRVSGVCWLEPKDLDAKRMQFQINGRDGVEVGSHLEGGAFVATGDGLVHFLAEDTPAELLRSMTTINGGEVVFLPYAE